MSCLDDILNGDRVIIGIRDYTECATPESKLYINDLPGFSLKKAANVTPESWSSGVEFLNQSIKLATQHVFDEFAHELTPYFEFGNIVETREVITYNNIVIPKSNVDRGLIVKRWRSEGARLFVESVFIKVSQAGSTLITIIDGSATFTKNVDLEVGINDINIGYKAESEQIKIVFNQTDFDTYDGAWTKGMGSGCRSCSSGSRKGIYITGWDGSNESSLTYGVGARVHMQCYEDNILCSLIPKMYFLLWYKAGILVLQEQINSSRINHIVTFGQEQAKQMLDSLTVEYDLKYKQLVRSAYEFLRNTKGECIKCNDIRYVQSHP